MRQRRGHVPEGWTQVSDFGKWELYAQTTDATVWRNYKLVLRGLTTGKANYRLGWNAGEQRLATGRDEVVFIEREPELYAQVIDYLRGIQTWNN